MKHPAILTRQKTALVIIDMQEKFAPAIPSFNTITANITKLILGFQLFKMDCIVTEQYPQGLGPTVEPVKNMFPLLEIIEKNEFACTDNAEFWKAVNPLKIETFVVCGVESHVCISQTVLGLIARKHSVHVVADAIGSRKSLDHDLALKKMEHAGTIISTTEMALFELIEKAGTESFKTIQKAIKINGPIIIQSIPKETPKPSKVPHTSPAVAPVAAAQTEIKPSPVPKTIKPVPQSTPDPSASPDNSESVAEFEINTNTTVQSPAPSDRINPPVYDAPPTDIVAESTINNADKAFSESDKALENIDSDLAAIDLSALSSTSTENAAPSTTPAAPASAPDEFNLEDINSILKKDAS